jgi:mRNA interferase MazF
MKEGDVAIASLPQWDGENKPRPVVLLRRMPGHGDWLVCGISTRLAQEVRGFDELMRPGDPDFADSGLHSGSLIRLAHLIVLPARSIGGGVGRIQPERLNRIRHRLAVFISEGS